MATNNEKSLADTQRISQEAEQMDRMNDGPLYDIYLLNMNQRLTDIENKLRERISTNSKKLEAAENKLNKKFGLTFRPKLKKELQLQIAKLNIKLDNDVARIGKIHQLVDNKEYLDREIWKKIDEFKQTQEKKKEKERKRKIEEAKILAAKKKREQQHKKETLTRSRARSLAIRLLNK